MSSSFDISTTFDALDDSLVSDVINLDSWASSLSPPVTSDEPVRHATPDHAVTPARPLRSPYPPSQLPLSPTPCYQPPQSPLRPPSQVYSPGPTRERVVSRQPPLHPPPVLWTPPPYQPPPRPTSLQNSTSALCGCLSVSTSGSHVDGNQGSTNRVYGVWLKSSTLQKP